MSYIFLHWIPNLHLSSFFKKCPCSFKPYTTQSTKLYVVTEIIEQVKNGAKPPFRPIVDDLYRDDPSSRDVVSLMKRCWGDDPADRPDFSALKNHISKLNK